MAVRMGFLLTFLNLKGDFSLFWGGNFSGSHAQMLSVAGVYEQVQMGDCWTLAEVCTLLSTIIVIDF